MSVEVEFCLLAERGVLEQQAVLLCESIRYFCGRYASAPITVISPRPERRPESWSQQRFVDLNASYLELSLASPVPDYGPSFRVLALAWRARQNGPPILIQLDSDTLFFAEPDLLQLEGHAAAARPVDMVGMCSRGPGDSREDLWRAMCAVNDVALDTLSTVHTTIGGHAVRASYNGGLIVAERGIYPLVEECFRNILAADLRPFSGANTGLRTGTGIVPPSGWEWWGTSQAAISIALAKMQRPLRILHPGYNVPLHLFDELDAPAEPIVHVHYHWLCTDPGEPNPMFDTRLPLTGGHREWLRERLPLAHFPRQ